ncbi:restriction endonuclease [Streptomyces sp. BK79]|uniref:restriction endonuclease n=1 Tax=Streptomyces sp. BK79 TaxID=3350097 RepID=UPI00376F4C62
MTVPEPRPRPERHGRRFDLRATAVYFGLVAVGLILAGWVGRTAWDVAQSRPAWAVVLVLGGVPVAVLCRRGRRGLSASRLARRTSGALEKATETALDALEERREPVWEATTHAVGQCTVVVPAEHDALTPDEFERVIADLCVRDGCADVEVVGGAGDLGADVLAVTPDGRRVVIQCKRYGDDNKVGSQDLQRFGGTCYTVHEADVAVLVTSGDFTAPAVEYAEQCGIVCVDEGWLRQWAAGRAPAPWGPGPAAGDDARTAEWSLG